MTKDKHLKRGQIRKLLYLQKGRCAISGKKIDPKNVSIDHIIPLSRKDLKDHPLYGKYWLVDTDINILKGALTLEELEKLINKIISNKSKTNELKEILQNQELEEMEKEEFDKYIDENYDDHGRIKD
jgi:CRISPR/Cas system Type II protein with McrA/HNH and RuvC-like nuclease domain